jgi:hypothetical protein
VKANQSGYRKAAVRDRRAAPIISGPSQADGIARFALRTKYEDLTAARRERLKVSILDAVACAINALGAPPIEACRAQTDQLGGPGGRCNQLLGWRLDDDVAPAKDVRIVQFTALNELEGDLVDPLPPASIRHRSSGPPAAGDDDGFAQRSPIFLLADRIHRPQLRQQLVDQPTQPRPRRAVRE